MNNCKYCKADCALRGEENLKECKGHIPMSNADRIRSMDDEELAEFLIDLADDGNLRIREWLKQPAVCS